MPKNPVENSLRQRVQALRQQLDGLQTASLSDDQPVSSGCAALDELLPRQGFVPGTLVEWLSERRGSGAGTLAMMVARQACRQPSRSQAALVVMDRLKRFYPPAAMAWGIDPERLLVIRAENTQDEIWALDQALRCRGVAAVWAFLDRLDGRAFRRLQLAAETGGTLGLFMRPADVRGQPSWSEAQLLVQPQPHATPPSQQPPDDSAYSNQGMPSQGMPSQGMPSQAGCGQAGRRVNIALVRCRGQSGRGANEGASVEVEIDEHEGSLREIKRRRHETRTLHLASRLADSTSRRRAARA